MEATADGSFDTNNVATAQAETLRQKGNEAFNRRHFLEAKNLYSQAIACHNTNHLLYGNRSAALYQLKDFHAALQDAEKAIEISPDWSKGYLRKGVACESLQLWDEAIDAFETILRLNNEEIVVSKAKIAITRVNFRRKKSVVTKGFLSGKNASDIYTEKENVSQYTTQQSWQLMLKKLLDGCNKRGMNSQGESVVLDDGIFAKLLQENEFQQLIYPGIPTEQLIHAPKKFADFIRRSMV
ncbi:unnamed protein product [Peronospora belbahrii]|uniref:Uncharacterized protein n=1 Tax=Peronospora belbahrii TaxID=622444 RepID=A0AAU9KWK1_9STRA|nr:unnamed protein product [Peronospora belbahrii]CAH0476026.1 unnamed protein product [Peronospora belbahrii]